MSMHYHFIGIKGSGMSSLAQILHDEGHRIQGVDTTDVIFTQKGLEDRSIPFFPFGTPPPQGAMVIVGNAFADEHPDVIQALRIGCEVIRYHAFLGGWLKGRTSIGVAGAHGKTSTTSLLAHVIGAIEPTSYLIGDGTGRGVEQARFGVVEACEYKRHFLAYRPDYAIVTNIDFDHPDYFTGFPDVVSAFDSFVAQAKKGVIGCGDDQAVSELNPSVPMTTYGQSEGVDVQAINIRVTPSGTTFGVRWKNEDIGDFHIRQHGVHAVQNTLAVITVALLEHLDLHSVKEALKGFRGAKRRFEIEEVGETVVVNDYAHHPAEIRATIEAARQKYPGKEVVAVFQPHTYSRTETFLTDFKNALHEADTVYGCPIFGSAREKEGALTIEALTSNVITEETVNLLGKHSGGVLLFMGAGDIEKYIQAYKCL